LLHAFIAAGLNCDRFAYGGQDRGKSFVVDEAGQLSEYAGE
jgi:hypothetical protein